MTERYIAFDVETPNCANDRMSAIGITVIEDGVIVDDFYSLVNPEARFDYFNVQLTGITPEMAKKAPTFSELWAELTLPVECYTQNGDRMPVVRKYVRQARKYAPIEKRIPPELQKKSVVEIYRAGDEPIELAKYRISWTTDLKVAQWFYDRALLCGQSPRHLYRGSIKPNQIIWYIDDREEREIMQYGSVHDISEIDR
jgi:hypothetical protein